MSLGSTLHELHDLIASLEAPSKRIDLPHCPRKKPLTPKLILLSTLFALCLATGQILFKFAALSWSSAEQTRPGILAVLSFPLFFAATLYAGSSFLWLYILKSAPLSKAYIFSIAGSALVPMAAWLIFKEPLDSRYWVGFVLMLTGSYLCSR